MMYIILKIPFFKYLKHTTLNHSRLHADIIQLLNVQTIIKRKMMLSICLWNFLMPHTTWSTPLVRALKDSTVAQHK